MVLETRRKNSCDNRDYTIFNYCLLAAYIQHKYLFKYVQMYRNISLCTVLLETSLFSYVASAITFINDTALRLLGIF